MAGAGQAERSLRGRAPPALCALQGASGASVRERWSSLRKRYEEQCAWHAAAEDLPVVHQQQEGAAYGAAAHDEEGG